MLKWGRGEGGGDEWGRKGSGKDARSGGEDREEENYEKKKSGDMEDEKVGRKRNLNTKKRGRKGKE